MLLSFEKWHGCHNDFMVVWLSDIDGDIVLSSIKRQATRLCDRHAGVGADGILVLHTARRGDLTPDRLTIINSDGSLAKNCGNGLRCAALSVLKMHREKGDPKELPEMVELTITAEGAVEGTAAEGMQGGAVKNCRFLPSQGGDWPLVAVEMGQALVNEQVAWADGVKASLQQAAKDLQLAFLLDDWGVCEIGNPHVVIQSDKVSRAALLQLGPYLQKSGDGINVHLVAAQDPDERDRKRAMQELGQPLGDLYRAYVWERGAGETQACGSGACAIVACAVQSGLLDRTEWVGVDMPGGRLYVKYEEDDDPVVLAGPGSHVFSGQVSI